MTRLQRPALDYREFPKLGTLGEQITFILEFGIRAPSTHNTQPWLFKRAGNKVLVLIDVTRKLAHADRSERDMYLSIGCLLKNIEIAGKYFGILEDIHINEAEGEHIATLTFREPRGQEGELLSLLLAIDRRYNARGKMLSLSAIAHAQIVNTEKDDGVNVTFISDSGGMHTLGSLTKIGIEEFHHNQKFRNEFSRWMHGNFSKTRSGIHGYSVYMPTIISYILPTLIRFVDLGKYLGKLNEQGIASAPLAGVICTNDDSKKSWVNAGRTVESLALSAFSIGASASFFAAPIEDATCREKLRVLCHTDSLPQFLVVFGVPEKKLPTTLRESVATRTLTHSTVNI